MTAAEGREAHLVTSIGMNPTNDGGWIRDDVNIFITATSRLYEPAYFNEPLLSKTPPTHFHA